MAYETLLVENRDKVNLITLNRPEALNAINMTMLTELCSVLKTIEQDKKIKTVVLTGSEKVFAAGADIKEMEKKAFVDMFLEDYFTKEHDLISSFRKPIIAAVSGYALGGGCELAMMCDFILASDTAKFGQPEINLGVMAGIGGTQRLTRAIGKSKSMDMNLTGRYMDALEAERVGLVSRIFKSNELLSRTLEIADKISEKSLLSVMAIKESIKMSDQTNLKSGLDFERRQFQSLFGTDDQKEGMSAFIEKRAPQFTDK